jgi:hypothetical protein
MRIEKDKRSFKNEKNYRSNYMYEASRYTVVCRNRYKTIIFQKFILERAIVEYKMEKANYCIPKQSW